MTQIEEIIEFINELKEEDLSKSVQDKLDAMIFALKQDVDTALKIDHCRTILDELDEHQNIPDYVRTQLWNISASLELI